MKWKKLLETDPIFNLIIRRTVDQNPGEDIKVVLEINTTLQEGNLSFTPGDEWFFIFTTSFFLGNTTIIWKYRLKRKSMTVLIGGHMEKWTVYASALSKIFVNEWGKDKDKIIMETWD